MFLDAQKTIKAGQHVLRIYNIKNPASNINDYFKIMYIRRFDNTVVLYNVAATTAPFEVLTGQVNSDITLDAALYLEEGQLSEYRFSIKMSQSRINSRSRIYINFPLYYSPGITNFPDQLQCKLDNIWISCKKDTTTPYRIIISNSPLVILADQVFTLTIFGIVAPQYAKRNNPAYAQDTLFLGVDPGSGNQFSEFIHLTPPPVKAGALNQKYLYLHFVDVDYPYTRSISDHTIKLFTETALPANSGLLLVFPDEYTQTMIITKQLECRVILDTGTPHWHR